MKDKHLADHKLAMRGVKHGKLVLTTTGKSCDRQLVQICIWQ